MVHEVDISIWEEALTVYPEPSRSYVCMAESDIKLIPGADNRKANTAWSLKEMARWLKNHKYRVVSTCRNSSDDGWLALCEKP